MQKRSPKKIILLHTLTLGFYLLYWCSQSRKEVNTILGRNAVPSVWLIILPLGIFWWAWLYGEALEEVTGRQIHRDSVMGLALIAALGAPSPFYIFLSLLPDDSASSSEQLSWAVIFVISLVFYLIYTVVLGIFPSSVQSKINKIQTAHPAI
jgi:cytochrome bd-type quinol oxidase subunit 2